MTPLTMRHVNGHFVVVGRYLSDAVQVACRSQGLVQGALSWFARQGDWPQVGPQIFGHDLVAGRSAGEASQEGARRKEVGRNRSVIRELTPTVPARCPLSSLASARLFLCVYHLSRFNSGALAARAIISSARRWP